VIRNGDADDGVTASDNSNQSRYIVVCFDCDSLSIELFLNNQCECRSLFAASRGNDGLKNCAYAELLREVAKAFDDRVRLTALIGGQSVMSEMPFDACVPTRDMFESVKKLAGATTKQTVDLTAAFKFVTHNDVGEKRYMFLGAPSTGVDGHAIITNTTLEKCIAYDISGSSSERWWKVFAGERQRVSDANAKGSRFISLQSATTDGTRVHFLYSNLNSLKRCPAGKRGIAIDVRFNYRGYKAMLPRLVQEQLQAAEDVIAKLKQVRLLCVCCC